MVRVYAHASSLSEYTQRKLYTLWEGAFPFFDFFPFLQNNVLRRCSFGAKEKGVGRFVRRGGCSTHAMSREVLCSIRELVLGLGPCL